ncbi:MAG: tetratricopeptide repeat protein, partial [Vicinamibacterales bacterium]
MVRRISGRHSWLPVLAALAVLVSATPVAAQTGRVQGVVVDSMGMPIEGATVIITQVNGSSKYETKTGKDGSYLQIGLIGGTSYLVTVKKDQLTAVRTVMMRGTGFRVNFTLEPNNPDGLPKEGVSAAAESQRVFSEGLELSRAGKFDDAIQKFTAVAGLNAKCSDCFYNIGYAYLQQKNYDKAEEAYKKAIEIKPDYADAFTDLAKIYTLQRKFDQAAQASAKAAEFGAASAAAPGALGGGNADALFNQGVTLWNGGKIAEAKKQFEAAIAANPNHAESHYQLGMALVNENNLKGAAAEFDTYLKLAPNGPNAATAKAIAAQLPK